MTLVEKASKEEILKSILALRNEIRHHDYLYYVKGKPKISDFEYDAIFKRLEDFERRYPEFITEDSPTQRVGDDSLEKFESKPHLAPMLSITNTYNEDEVRQFHKRITKILLRDDFSYSIEPKVDGVAFSAVYENDFLIHGLTRGNGISGDDITQNLRTIRGLPLTANWSSLGISRIEVRGEVLMYDEEFEKMNLKREEMGLKVFANPRNATSGSLKLLDPKVVAKRPLRILVHSFGDIQFHPSAETTRDHIALLKQCGKLGFPVIPTHRISGGSDVMKDILDAIETLDHARHDLPYTTDGCVVKVCDMSLREELGNTGHSPRWIFAYKYAAEEAETLLKDITIQVGRTGAITPVACLEPVRLSGTTVSSATLHNADEIERLDVRIGDYVVVTKAGEIIPKVVRVNKEKRDGSQKPYKFPTICPCKMKSPLFRLEGEVAWYCVEAYCPSQLPRKIEHFASKKCMDIDGLGPALIKQLVDCGAVKSIPDLYTLTKKKLMSLNLERMGEKTAENLIAAIESSKTREPHRLLHGLGVRYVGEEVSKLLLEKVSDVSEVFTLLSKDEITEIEGIGPVVADAICSSYDTMTYLLNDLRSLDVNTKVEQTECLSNDLEGKTFVITGTLANYKRDEAKKLIESRGGKVTGSVSKKTDFLICGVDPGSKLTKAEKLGILVLNEADFVNLIGSNGS